MTSLGTLSIWDSEACIVHSRLFCLLVQGRIISCWGICTGPNAWRRSRIRCFASRKHGTACLLLIEVAQNASGRSVPKCSGVFLEVRLSSVACVYMHAQHFMSPVRFMARVRAIRLHSCVLHAVVVYMQNLARGRYVHFSNYCASASVDLFGLSGGHAVQCGTGLRVILN
jgi:hypothetical protein